MWHLLILQAAIAQAVSQVHPHPPSGIYTHSDRIHDHDIVIPRKVTTNGDLISHNVTHHHERDGENEVHYLIAVAETEYHLQLKPAEGFIGPGAVVERRRRDLHIRQSLKNSSSKCHYRGSIRGHAESHVALSACNGLAGFIRGDHGEFWLEPVAKSKTNTSEAEGHPHIIFRRAAPMEIGVGRKHREKRKKSHVKNCGTREPRHLKETRLQWQTQAGQVRVHGRGRRKRYQAKKLKRSKKSVSRPRYVEALVVADTSMMVFHQDDDVETYLLTIMNMVSSNYHHPSIGNFINVVVVNIILMEEDETKQGFNVTVNADKTLSSFCKWQRKLNPGDDSHPNHHDVAILVTREDICSKNADTACDTLGLAQVAGMCHPEKCCSVNEDNGIIVAHTITHELGHNFGMVHDTEIGCKKRDGNILHVMTPVFELARGIAWSKCSRRDITNFLDSGKGDCLMDEPADNEYLYPDLPPGAMYDAERQCKLQFGVEEASVCTSLEEICSQLWCQIDGSCTSRIHPAAPGTHCGKYMWCQNQECVPIDDKPSAIDGGWGDWGSWGECSRSCGAGVSIMERKCDHPEPAQGGKFCVGERRRYRTCNTDPCPEGSPNFRSVQCTEFNDKEYHGKNYTWQPHFKKSEPCKLYCSNTEQIISRGEAADGTPCNVESRDMCIGGICKNVGCDWAVDSTATQDRCGICLGDGTQCEIIGDSYNGNEEPGYEEVVIIPSGARNIKIEELGNSETYIAIGVANTEIYFLNGQRLISQPGEYEVAGTLAVYERDQEREKVRIPGPIKEDIAVYLLFTKEYQNLGLRYEYAVLKAEQDPAFVYSWVFSEWSLCSATCGGGKQSSNAFCHERRNGIVEEQFCNGTMKPESILRECNQNPCPTRWWVGPWQMCLVTCGDGALRKRSVMCVSSGENNESSDLALPDSDCSGQIRPDELGPCPDLPPCESSSEVPLVVVADNNETAFKNITRNDTDGITIISSSTTERSEILYFNNAADAVKENSMYYGKFKWVVSKWSDCSYGKRSRMVTCSNAGDCDPDIKPWSTERCQVGKWVTGKWGACNATCLSNAGVKRRKIECRERTTNLMSDDCSPERRPLDTRRCYSKRQCEFEKPRCRDTLVPVRLCVTYRRMCEASPILRVKCCSTCSRNQRHDRHNKRHPFKF